MNFSDEELFSLALEGNETAKNMLYEENKYIVDIILKKYKNAAKNAGLDMYELEQEAYFAFSDALNSYRSDKNASISTFISMCVERRIQKIIRNNRGDKAKFLSSTYSLDFDYNKEGNALKDMISDIKSDPLYNLTNKENYEELIVKINKNLSEAEIEVLNYYLKGNDYQVIAKKTNKSAKQIDNTIQRIRHKIRDILEDN